MNINLLKFSALTLAFGAFGQTAKAQTFSIVIEPGSILDSGGAILSHSLQDASSLNFFFAESDSDLEPLKGLFADPLTPLVSEFASLSSLNWNPLIQTTSSTFEFWATPDFLTNNKLNRTVAGSRILVGIFEAESVDDLEAGDQVGLLGSTSIIPDLGNIDFNFASFDILAGQEGSLQLVSAVPEPSSYAAIAGFAVLGLTVLRRRRA